ncbi:MAG: exosome 3'-_5 exonuclease subunit ski4 (Csl4) [Chrysothrix sp. TS-e1954]|nr:MAG: exosome 3'->5 exonuclease subunit ski4 (Csl4) [Chrysothrix sp. TS-e1954]
MTTTSPPSFLLPGDPIPLDSTNNTTTNTSTKQRAHLHTAGPGTHSHGSGIYASLAGRHVASSTRNTQNRDARASVTHSIQPFGTRAQGGGGGGEGGGRGVGRAALPRINSRVLARITKVSVRQAGALVLCVYTSPTSTTSSTTTTSTTTTTPSHPPPPTPTPHPLPTPHPALLRREDIRATEKDRQSIATSFAVGDIIRATIVSLGDNSGGYYLSTAEDGLGVVLAWSGGGIAGEGGGGNEGAGGGNEGGGEKWGGEALTPVSWREMVGLSADAGADADAGAGVGVGKGTRTRMRRREERKVARPDVLRRGT